MTELDVEKARGMLDGISNERQSNWWMSEYALPLCDEVERLRAAYDVLVELIGEAHSVSDDEAKKAIAEMIESAKEAKRRNAGGRDE